MDLASLIGRLLISLALVLGLMWLLARRVKRPGAKAGGKLVDVLGRQQLTRNSSVAIVRVMDQALILGVTDGTVSVIGETDLAAVEARLEEPAARRVPSLPRSARPKIVRNRPAPALRPLPAGAAVEAAPARSPLTGSALSPATWHQTLESLRALTARTR